MRELQSFINIRTMHSAADSWMMVDGKRVLNFCTNNYLGLANHPALKRKAQEAIEKWGVGPGAVRTIAGTQALHLEFERRMAEFKGVDASLLVQSGFCANQAAIPALVGRDRESNEQDVIFSDRAGVYEKPSERRRVGRRLHVVLAAARGRLDFA